MKRYEILNWFYLLGLGSTGSQKKKWNLNWWIDDYAGGSWQGESIQKILFHEDAITDGGELFGLLVTWWESGFTDLYPVDKD